MIPTDNTILASSTGTIVLADSPASITLPTDQRGLQITIGPGDATGGTATLKLRPVGSESYEDVIDGTTGAAISWTISAGQKTYIVQSGRFSSAKITLSGTGSGKTVKYSFSGV